MIYRYYKIYEMDTNVCIYTTRAKDLHDANMQFMTTHSLNDYDYITVNDIIIY